MRKHHFFLLIAICVIFVLKGYVAVIYQQYPVGGNRYPIAIGLVNIAARIFYYLCRAAKRRFGIPIAIGTFHFF